MESALEITESVSQSGTEPWVDVPKAYAALLARCGELRRRAEAAEKASVRKEEDLLLSVVKIADAMDRILGGVGTEATETVEQLRNHVRVTRKMVGSELARHGVRPMGLVGTIVDAGMADVEDAEDDPTTPDGIVLKEVVVGYRWAGNALRRARVVVSRRP